MNEKKMKIFGIDILEWVGMILFLIFILSIPTIIRKVNLKGGSEIVKATLANKVRCNRNKSKCYVYWYTYNGKEYSGQTVAKKNLSTGDQIEVEISLSDPSVSFLIESK